MRLVIVSDTLAGGMGALARAHAAWFAAHDWAVTLAAPADGEAPHEPVAFVELPAVRSVRDLRAMAAARRVLRTATTSPPDVVHAHGLRSLALTRSAGLPKPYVSVHGNHPSSDDPPLFGAVRRTAFALVPRLVRGASTGEPSDASGWTYYPFASPRLATLEVLPFPQAGRPTVAWLGLLDDRKQPDVLVRAAALLREDGVDLRVLVAGTGPRFDEIKALVAELDAPVELLGHADPAIVLRDAWVLCLFSHSEGTPLAVMEAMWAGRSVVASPLPGNRFLIGETGAYAADVDHAVDALRAVLADRDAAAARGVAAAERIRSLVRADTPWPELDAAYRR